MEWEAVIGLEIHAQLNTHAKIFSGASTRYGAEPNRQACALDLGMPGMLPVLNSAVVEKAIMLGLAINARITQKSVFARKNYFYPDLPKGYQISQYDRPIVAEGYLEIDLEEGKCKRVGITRAHLEEDAGKSLHDAFDGFSGIDLNRAGTPLLEIVSEPDLRSAREAVAYMKKLHELVRYLDICDGNMQEGSFRCDANVSVRPLGQETLGTRTEIKNLNSFRFVERAINHEISRQVTLLDSGEKVIQETRLYDPDRDETRTMRSKEEANDYRYFPDPDLLPVEISEQDIERIRATLPELPETRRARLVKEYGLSAYDAGVLTSSREMADFLDAVLQEGCTAKLAANWLMGEYTAALNRADLVWAASPVSASALAGLLRRIEDGTLSSKLAKEVFDAMWQGEGDADAIIQTRGLQQISDTGFINEIIDQIIAANPLQVEQFRSGKDKVFGFFVGQVMKKTHGKANPGYVNERLKSRLKE